MPDQPKIPENEYPANASTDDPRANTALPLDYISRQAELPRREGAGNLLGAGGGCAYTVLAILVSIFLINRTSANLLIVSAVLLGVPFIIALCLRGWRAFALGILISVGLIILAFGICSAIVFRGLGH